MPLMQPKKSIGYQFWILLMFGDIHYACKRIGLLMHGAL